MSSRNVRSTSRFHSPARRTALIGMTVVASVLLVTACGGDATPQGEGVSSGESAPDGASVDTPKVDPSNEPSRAETPSPIEDIDVPQAPFGLDSNDAIGAISTAEYFIDLYDYANQAGELSKFEETFTSDCTFCLKTVADVKDAKERNLHIDGGVLERSEGKISESRVDSDLIVVYLDITQTSGTLLNASGTTVSKVGGGPLNLEVQAELVEGQWAITEVYGSAP